MAPQAQEQDEFEEAAAAADFVSGYEATRDADVEDQREFRLVPSGTPCDLGLASFTYGAAKGNSKPAILVKVQVNSPAEYADGSSNFQSRLSLNPVVGKNEDGSDKKGSGWDMCVATLSYLYAAANQVSAREGKREMIDVVLAEFPNLDADDVPAFHAALVENANEKLKGATVKTKAIAIKKGGTNPKGGTYRDAQDFGTLDYPKAAKK